MIDRPPGDAPGRDGGRATDRPALPARHGWGTPEARDDIVAALAVTPDPDGRDQAIRAGALALSDEHLTEMLRNPESAALRSAGLEIAILRGASAVPMALALLDDEDPDVILMALQILDRVGDSRATAPVRPLLSHSNPNVVQAAILALGDLGVREAIPELLELLGGEPWVAMAAAEAVGALGATEGVAKLVSQLHDPLLGAGAATALGRIGGLDALTALAAHCDEGDDRRGAVLEALALALETSDPIKIPGLRIALGRALSGGMRRRDITARALLALGPGPEDHAAVAALVAATPPETRELPACLARREDLIGTLLRESGSRRRWGFQLAVRFPGKASHKDILDALAGVVDPADLEVVSDAADEMPQADIADALLDLLLRLDPEATAATTDLVRRHRDILREAVDRRTGIEDDVRRRLHVASADQLDDVMAALADIGHEERAALLATVVADRPDLASGLPWADWLSAAPDAYAGVAAMMATDFDLGEAMPALRRQLVENPSHHIVRLIGQLGDGESVPALLELLRNGESALKPFVLRALAQLGGAEALGALRALAEPGSGADRRHAFPALASCGTEADAQRFLSAVSDEDWYVRFAVCTYLERVTSVDASTALKALAVDPVASVADRARALLAGSSV